MSTRLADGLGGRCPFRHKGGYTPNVGSPAVAVFAALDNASVFLYICILIYHNICGMVNKKWGRGLSAESWLCGTGVERYGMPKEEQETLYAVLNRLSKGDKIRIGYYCHFHDVKKTGTEEWKSSAKAPSLFLHSMLALRIITSLSVLRLRQAARVFTNISSKIRTILRLKCRQHSDIGSRIR